jgi:hypothetical protein
MKFENPKPTTLHPRPLDIRLERTAGLGFAIDLVRFPIFWFFETWTWFSRVGSHLDENLESGSESGYPQFCENNPFLRWEPHSEPA